MTLACLHPGELVVPVPAQPIRREPERGYTLSRCHICGAVQAYRESDGTVTTHYEHWCPEAPKEPA